MSVLADSDILCKLALADLLDPALRVLGYGRSDCARLPALPYMLRRGRLRESYGPKACAKLAPIVSSICAMTEPGDRWLDRLASVTDIDPGEAQLFAKAAEDGMMLMTGDKKALQGVGTVPGLSEALQDRVVTLEAILESLCVNLGVDRVRQSIKPIRHLDLVLRVCFSDTNPSPVDGLASYNEDLASSVLPLVLWKHDGGSRW